jgi:hypothetical protein
MSTTYSHNFGKTTLAPHGWSSQKIVEIDFLLQFPNGIIFYFQKKSLTDRKFHHFSNDTKNELLRI